MHLKTFTLLEPLFWLTGLSLIDSCVFGTLCIAQLSKYNALYSTVGTFCNNAILHFNSKSECLRRCFPACADSLQCQYLISQVCQSKAHVNNSNLLESSSRQIGGSIRRDAPHRVNNLLCEVSRKLKENSECKDRIQISLPPSFENRPSTEPSES